MFDRLLRELKLQILKYLSPKEIVTVAQVTYPNCSFADTDRDKVCKEWKLLCEANELWRFLCWRSFKVRSILCFLFTHKCDQNDWWFQDTWSFEIKSEHFVRLLSLVLLALFRA